MTRLAVFDARSATLDRMTGWERYAGCLAHEFDRVGDVEVWRPDASTIVRRLATDVPALGLARTGVVHFPTFPPQWVGTSSAVVLTVHDMTWWTHPETASWLGLHYYRPALERAVRNCARVVTHTETVAAEVRDHFGLTADRVTPVFCGAEFADPTMSAERPPVRDRPYLLTVGTLEPRKNLRRLVEAYQRSAIRHELELVVVGRAAWGDRPEGVTLLEGVDDRQLRHLYEGAEAVVLASLQEGFGLPLVEAMVLGVPVMCSDLAVLREVTLGEATYFDPLDVESIGDALDGAATLVRPSEEVVRRLREQFSWAGVAGRLRTVYREVGA